jgi:HK97 family phage portal protein
MAGKKKLTAVEERASVEDPTVPISSAQIIDLFSISGMTDAGVSVNVQNALGVPAIWSAVNFISGTIAGLPLNIYRKEKGGRKQSKTRIAQLLHNNVNEETSSFAWRKEVFERVLTSGRSYTLIVRGEREPIRYLWPLETGSVKPMKGTQGQKLYEVKSGRSKKVYEAKDIIDISFMMKDNGVDHYSPILTNKDSIGLGIAATRYGSRFFQNGGVPPFVLMGNFQSAAALNRASADLSNAVKAAAKESRLALTVPNDHELKSIGVDPDKSQLVELKKALIEDYARIYQLPPVFLQDLSHGTFSNTEQQDLHFVKHTVKRWVEQFEQELNLKLFGWDKHDKYVEFNLDGLLRGDFKTRMDGLSTGVQNGMITPNEARRMDNRQDLPGGDQLMIQGATVPLAGQQNGDSNEE